MAGKVHTDSEALYAVRSAITKFAGSFQEAQGNFSQCFEQMNYQVEDHIRMLDSDIESCEEEKRVLQRQVEECEEKQSTAQREQSQHQNGRTDSFVCDRCGTRMMLKVYGDSTSCKSSSGCSGTMHRFFNDGEYHRLNVEIQQLEDKKKRLQEGIADLDKRIVLQRKARDDTAQNYSDLQMHQQSIMSLLVFGSGEDPETAVAFIDKALASLGDYQAVGFDVDGGIEKKNEVDNAGNNEKTSIDQISSWIKEINPHYNPFLPPKIHPYNRNCGSCAYAVECRLNGQEDAVATSTNIGTDPAMENVTGKKCEYMPLGDIEKKLRDMGAGSHLIVGINRHPTPFGRPQAGHWFNAYYDGNRIYTVDGQCGEIFDWPHDYGDISEWCALV